MVAQEGYVDFPATAPGFASSATAALPLCRCSRRMADRARRATTSPPLERLAEERPVVLYDQIGCGSSDRPTDIEWSVDVFRDEVEAIRAQLGLDRIHLLGTSWGGMLALEHVLAGANGIVGLVLSSTLASIDEWATEQKRLRDELPPRGRRGPRPSRARGHL